MRHSLSSWVADTALRSNAAGTLGVPTNSVKHSTAARGPASVYRWKGAVRGTTIPFTTIEDNPHITPALKLPPQLFVAAQTATDDYEDEHFLSPTSKICAHEAPCSPRQET
jgi:hypothetical protein